VSVGQRGQLEHSVVTESHVRQLRGRTGVVEQLETAEICSRQGDNGSQHARLVGKSKRGDGVKC